MREIDNKDYLELSRYTFFVGIAAGVLVFFFFGILDYYALPQNFLLAWKIRVVALGAAVSIGLLVSLKKKITEYKELFLVILLSGGIIGILAIIAIAYENEVAYWYYYAGLIVMMLYAGLVFRLSVKSMYVLSGLSLLGYNIVAIFIQGLYLHFNSHSNLLANDFFLSCSAVLAVLGSYQFMRYKDKIWEQHQKINEEVKLHLEAKQKAQEADRLKTAFLANMSHEIRTPLNAIVGFAHMLGDDDLVLDERITYTSIIDNNADQLLNIINDIVDIAKIEGDQMLIKHEMIDVSKVLEQCYLNSSMLIEQKQKSHIELKTKYDDLHDALKVKGDQFRLLQVFNNLIGNALKFTQEGYVEFGVEEVSDTMVTFFVKDSGIGIDTVNQKSIFREFRQEHEQIATEFGGTGLGLAITKKLLHLMHGEIWVTSTKGKGTKMSFTLPRYK